jgi:ribosomal-protein-alanine acetyltransferase
MTHDDVEAVLELEESSASAWSLSSVKSELERDNGVRLVAVQPGEQELLGWCCGMVVADEAELLKIVVTSGARQRGIGTSLLVQFEKQCQELRARKVFLEVRGQNTVARALYIKCGFTEISVRKGYYREPKDDAIIYVKKMYNYFG